MAIKVAELKGQRAGILKEIELQNKVLSDLQQSIDAVRPGTVLPGRGRVLGPGPDLFRQQTTIRQRLITLRSQLAQINEEIRVLTPNDSQGAVEKPLTEKRRKELRLKNHY
jgi:hypothetical protein